MKTIQFDRFAAVCAFAVGLSGVVYAIAFITLLHTTTKGANALSQGLLVGAGLLSTAVFTAVYGRIREIDPLFALWGLIVAVAAAFGSVAHGGFELAKIASPPAVAGDPKLPNPTDPRGLFTFALSAIAVLVVSGLILSGANLPRGLAYLGIASAVLLLLVYFGRLLVYNPKEPWVLASAVLAGFIVNPAWYLWLGLTLWRGEEAPHAVAQASPAS